MKRIYLKLLLFSVFLLVNEVEGAIFLYSKEVWNRDGAEKPYMGDSIDYADESDITSPEFKGGQDAFERYRKHSLKYPDEAYRNNIEGIVLISCMIDAKGKVLNPSVISSSDSCFNKEAIRFVLGTTGLWIPGTRNGENIVRRTTVSVPFFLNKVDMVDLQSGIGKRKLTGYIIIVMILIGVIYNVSVYFRKRK